MLQNLHAEELRILLSIPGVGSNAAANIIPEIVRMLYEPRG
jgi:ribose 5-phosphate isomerase RpiB